MGKTEAYFAKLEKLSAVELARSAGAVVHSERRNVAAVIAHLAEMARRETHLELGYKSLFDYCVRHLRLSEGSVWSRIQVANVCRKYPQVLEHLAAWKISLSVAGRLASKLTGENLERLLGECEGRTKREVEEILVALEPKPETPAGIRRAPMNTETGAKAKESPAQKPATPVRKPSCKLEPAQAERYNFRFSADKVFKEKLERLAEVLGAEAVEKNMAEVLEQALDIALDRRDPKRKLERRRKKAASPEGTRPDEVQAKKRTSSPKRSRYIPSAVRAQLMEEASYQCEYRGEGGVRCSARAGLEIDHVKPFAKGGSGGCENLRVLCQRHNLFLARKEYGEEFVREKVAQRLQEASASTLSEECSLGP